MIYAVVPFRAENSLGRAIRECKLPFHHYDGEDSSVYFVSYSGTTQELASKIGLDGTLDASGIVLPVNNYSGFANPNIWEWLKSHDTGI